MTLLPNSVSFDQSNIQTAISRRTTPVSDRTSTDGFRKTLQPWLIGITSVIVSGSIIGAHAKIWSHDTEIQVTATNVKALETATSASVKSLSVDQVKFENRIDKRLDDLEKLIREQNSALITLVTRRAP
jgi:hypothetical protein